MGFIKTVGIGLGGLILLGACFGDNGDDSTSTKDKDKPLSGQKVDRILEEVAAEAEPTQEDGWRQNFDDQQRQIRRAFDRRLPGYPGQPVDAMSQALASCADIADQRPLAKRVKRAGARWSSDPDQTLVVLSIVADNVCPDVAPTHVKQVAAKRKADAAAARRRAAAARRAAERRAVVAQQQAQNVYYANCSAVEAAGAAPIYTGQPGYSRDLDRDGDGVACEQ